MLGAGLVIILAGTASTTAASSSDIAGLAAQRQALQSQAQSLIGKRDVTVAQLLQTKDRIADLRRQLSRNGAQLADLERQQASLSRTIQATEEQIRGDRGAVGNLAREQYKARDQVSIWEIAFGSKDLGQVVNRIVASQTMSNRQHAAVLALRNQEHALDEERQALSLKQGEAQRVQEALTATKSQMLALSGAYQSQVNAMDAASADLLARIGKVDAAIAAASRPPGAGALSYSQQQVAGIIVAAAARYGVDSNMLIHVAMCESGLNPNAYDAASGASGLFQFMPGTFYGNGGHNIWDPNDQATVAARMFSQGLGGAWTCR